MASFRNFQHKARAEADLLKRSRTAAFNRPGEDAVPLNMFSESVKDMVEAIGWKVLPQILFLTSPIPSIYN